MGTFDIVLLVIFFGFVGAGFYFGLIHTLGAIIGVVVGVIAASNLYHQVSPFLQFFMLREGIANILAFIIILLLVSRLIGYMVHMIDKGFRVIPFTSFINHLAGGLLGFIEATLVIGTILFVANNFDISPAVNAAIESSAFAGLLIKIAVIVTPLIPEAIKNRVPV